MVLHLNFIEIQRIFCLEKTECNSAIEKCVGNENFWNEEDMQDSQENQEHFVIFEFTILR